MLRSGVVVDAWWPRWLRAQFRPVLGGAAYAQLLATVAADNPPNTGGEHRGSAYQDGWCGHARKDLRTVLGRGVRGRYSQESCGRGSLRRGRAALRRSLAAALRVPAARVYGGDAKCPDASQWCYDAIELKAVGGAKQPLIHWHNRPTYQQVNEIQRRVPR